MFGAEAFDPPPEEVEDGSDLRQPPLPGPAPRPYVTQIQYFKGGYIAELNPKLFDGGDMQPWCLYQVTISPRGRTRIKALFYCASLAECTELVNYL